MIDLDDIESEPRQLLMDVWGYPDFRPWQKEVLPEILNGHDVLCVAPTGGGKSLLFQLPAMMREGCVLVTSPLIALMKDQAAECEMVGIPASYISSDIENREEQDRRMNDLRAGAYKVFFVSPERFRSSTFCEALAGTDISLVVNDEAHCASQWGHDFRPAYARLFEIPDLIEKASGKRPQILALTATATPDIEDDVAAQCGMSEYVRYVADPIRENLSWSRIYGQSPWRIADELAGSLDLRQGRYIFYSTTRKLADDVVKAFTDKGVPADKVAAYHAGMRMDDRRRVQEGFKLGTVRVVVATSAFGMGINVPDIRKVVHFGVPDSLESYVQQAGRAGRDGKPSECVLVHSDRAVEVQEYFFETSNPSYHQIQRVWAMLNAAVSSPRMTLRETAAGFARKMFGGGRDTKHAGQISTILNVLESTGAVARKYAKHSTPLRLKTESLKSLIQSDRVHATVKRVASVLEDCLVNPQEDGRAWIAGQVDLADVASKSKVSESWLRQVLKKLEDKNVAIVGETFKGKDLLVIGYGKPLSDFVSAEDVNARRARAQEKLNAMVNYAELNSEHARKKAIQTYFLGPTTDTIAMG